MSNHSLLQTCLKEKETNTKHLAKKCKGYNKWHSFVGCLNVNINSGLLSSSHYLKAQPV